MQEIQKDLTQLYRDALRIHLKRNGYNQQQTQKILKELFNK